MNLCSEEHDEVCYEGRNCPVCNVRDNLQSEIDRLTIIVDQKSEKIDELEADITDLTDKLN